MISVPKNNQSMCDNIDNTNPDEATFQAGRQKQSHPRDLKVGKCAKCKVEEPEVQVRNISYCKNCFLAGTVYRFRTQFHKIFLLESAVTAASAAEASKVTIMDSNEKEEKARPKKVLLACSGGASSRCLLDLFAAFSKPSHSTGGEGEGEGQQKSRIPSIFPDITVFHVDQSVLLGPPAKELVEEVERLAKGYDLPFTSSPLEGVFSPPSADTMTDNKIRAQHDSTNESAKERLLDCFGQLKHLTDREELLKLLTFQCMEKEARRLGCNVLVLGDCATLLAVRVLADTSRGKGIRLHEDLALSIVNKQSIQVLRPIRDMLIQEVDLYNELQSLKVLPHLNLSTMQKTEEGGEERQEPSIDRLVTEFIRSLQAEMPSTVSTITKTAFKIPDRSGGGSECPICLGPIERQVEFDDVDMNFKTKEEASSTSLLSCYSCKTLVKSFRDENYKPPFISK